MAMETLHGLETGSGGDTSETAAKHEIIDEIKFLGPRPSKWR